MTAQGPPLPDAPERADSAPRAARGLVLQNALFLTVAQALCLPLSILMNAMMARHLGADALGYIYLAQTFNAFGFLAVDWGQQGALPALVATDRSRAGALLGTSLAFRITLAILVFGILNVLIRLLGYDANVRIVVALVFAGYLLSSVVNACQDTILGFERTDIGAIRQVGEQLSSVVIVLPILLLGGNLHVTLVGTASAILVMMVFVVRSLKPTGVGRLSVQRTALSDLLARGTPFVFFNLAMVLQPNIDAVFLSKLSTPEVVGWHAAARKLLGLLVFPAAALIGALYPTLCRLYATDQDGFRRTANSALRGTSLLVMPIALGCALYPEIGSTIYSRAAFAPAESNLRVLSIFLFLMYFTMPIGTTLLASGRQRSWALVQSLCVAVSAALDPVLVPWFQRRNGNGGLGICTAAVVSEVLVVICGLLLVPRGFFERRLWHSLSLVMLSGAAMAAVAWLLRGFNSFLAAPFAVAAYAATLWLTGGISEEEIDAVRDVFRRKFKRAG